MTGKQLMLNAYRGLPNDRVAIAPEFWYYYPAKILEVDMIEFEREVPFHLALKQTFSHFNCEGWGIASPQIPHGAIESTSQDTWLDDDTLEVNTTTQTKFGDISSTLRYHREEPSWVIERPVKNIAHDLSAWEEVTFGVEPEEMNVAPLINAWEETGESFLLEACVGLPFFDTFAGAREGGFETAIYEFLDPEMQPLLERLQQRHIEHLTRLTRTICERTPLESLFIGCSWSCNSLIGPNLWRRWDKPAIKAVADEAHRHGRLLHIHFHGKCLETVADFAEIGVDCICPFERPPGGDVASKEDLRSIARLLEGCTTMNGNIHTVDTLIRGTADDVRREVLEILTTFAGNPRVILGTGDQVGRETPAENLLAMVEAGKSFR